MKASLYSGAAAMAAATLAGTASAQNVPPVEIIGQHFFYSNNGSQFFMRGVAYQQDAGGNGTQLAGTGSGQYNDPLQDGPTCERDIPYLVQLNTNVIRTYAIDPTKNHDACMHALANAGIYVISDLSSPGESIESDEPAWNAALYQRYTGVVDALANYTNTLGFFAGNEVSSMYNQTAANAFVKAAVRDTKNYIKQKNYRTSLGVGYATADVPGRDDLAHYYACDPQDSAIDFWGYNVYSWCGNSTYEQSDYSARVQFFENYPKPAFFAEYGCNQVPGGAAGRPFTEVAALYGDKMTPVFSGGIVYMYFQESNDFGLVTIGSDNKVTPLADFTSLSAQIAKISPSSTQSSNYSPSNSAPACPTVFNSPSSAWLAAATPLPPSPNPALCACEVAAGACTLQQSQRTNLTAFGDTFSYICGHDSGSCAGIAANATTGSYGAVGACAPADQLAFVMNQWYARHSSVASDCSFGGLASLQSATTASTCTSFLQQAGTAGTGAVASPTGAQVSAGKTTGSKGAASSVSVPSFFNFGSPIMIAYTGLAVVSALAVAIL